MSSCSKVDVKHFRSTWDPGGCTSTLIDSFRLLKVYCLTSGCDWVCQPHVDVLDSLSHEETNKQRWSLLSYRHFSVLESKMPWMLGEEKYHVRCVSHCNPVKKSQDYLSQLLFTKMQKQVTENIFNWLLYLVAWERQWHLRQDNGRYPGVYETKVIVLRRKKTKHLAVFKMHGKESFLKNYCLHCWNCELL